MFTGKYEVEYIDNEEELYWIKDSLISNKSDDGIYPKNITNVGNGKSVIVYRASEDGNKTAVARLACIDYEKLETMFLEGKEINLNYAYIDCFSWYRNIKNYRKSETVEFDSFQACCSLWVGSGTKNTRVDFWKMRVKNGNMSFTDSVFYKIDINIATVYIPDGRMRFEECSFYNSEVNISNVICRTREKLLETITFARSVFKNSDLIITMIRSNISISLLCLKMTGGSVRLEFVMNMDELVIFGADIENMQINHSKIEDFNLQHTSVRNIKLKKCKLYGHCEMKFTASKKIEIIDCSVNSILHLDAGDGIEKFSIEGMINNGRIEFINTDKIIDVMKKNKDSSQFLVMKENFKLLGQNREEDICYLEYRRLENKNIKGSKRIVDSIVGITSGYGTKPQWMLITVLLSIVAFATVYYTVPYISFGHAKTYIDYLYVSGITYFTVGYGDITPLNSLTKLVVLLESFVGISSMSYLLVVLSRKIIR